MKRKFIQKVVGAVEYIERISKDEDKIVSLQEELEVYDTESDLELINEVIKKYNDFNIDNNETDNTKIHILHALRFQLEYFRRGSNKSEVLEKLEELYYISYNEIILCILAKLQAKSGIKNNIIFDDDVIKYKSALIYRIRGDIYRKLLKNKKLDEETQVKYQNLSIYNYRKGLELEADNKKLLHSLGRALIIKATKDSMELIDEGIEYIDILLEKFDENKSYYSREIFMCYNVLLAAYLKKCEFSKRFAYTVWVENAKRLDEYIDIMNEFKVNRKTKRKYYADREKAYMEIAVGYMKFGYNECSKDHIDQLIESYQFNENLFKAKKLDIVIRAFATKAKIRYYQGDYVKAKENLEMALNLESLGKVDAKYTRVILNDSRNLIGEDFAVEEGVIESIDEDKKEVIIYCKTCGKLHLAKFESFLNEYSKEDLMKIKEDRTILEFTALRSFINPLDEECNRDACFIKVTENKYEEYIEKTSLIEAQKIEKEETEKEEVIADSSTELNLVEADCVGILGFNMNFNKGYAYTLYNTECAYELEDIKTTMCEEELKGELIAYDNSKSYIRFDIYESVNKNSKRKKYVAKNIELLL